VGRTTTHSFLRCSPLLRQYPNAQLAGPNRRTWTILTLSV
jgi:hypothetical protein